MIESISGQNAVSELLKTQYFSYSDFGRQANGGEGGL